MDEHEAIRRCQGGDEEAFGYLMELHQDKAYRIACTILSNSSVAEEVTQEAFLAAWRSIHTFEVGHPFAPWLRRILVHCAIKRLPKIQMLSMSDEDCPDPPSPAQGPEDALTKQETSEIIRKALARLSPQRNLILKLYYYVECQISEIADLLALPEGTVKSEMHRAKKELERMLKGVLDQ